MNCPNCGAELPSPTHVGLHAKPENYITDPLELSPGTKYRRYFSILYLPRKSKADITYEPCIVIASEEREINTDRSFIAGAKFYPDQLDLLRRAWEDVMLSYMAFMTDITGRPASSIFMSELSSLYNSARRRSELGGRLTDILRRMREAKKI